MQKNLTWLHLSDIHFNSTDNWRDASSRNALLLYLKKNFEFSPELKPSFIFCTGDIAFGNLSADPIDQQYIEARAFFDELLQICGDEEFPLAKERLFVVPGNHDIDRKVVNGDAQTALQAYSGDARAFSHKINVRFDRKDTEFTDAYRRLQQYDNFVRDYLPHQYDSEGRGRYAKIVELGGLKIGVSGFNSAWTCAGDEDDRNIWLAAEWQFNQSKKIIKDADLRIGLIHHPTDWFNIADREVATVRVASDYDFWLHGHSHSAWVTPIQSHSVIAAGAVGAEHSEEFGINITAIDFITCTVTTYLHSKKSGSASWTIAPIGDHAPMGQWVFPLTLRAATMAHEKGITLTRGNDSIKEAAPAMDGFITRFLNKRLEDSLRSFSTHSNSWVDRIISTVSELETNADAAPKIDISELIASPASAFIRAPAQYGLTCLAHYFILESWKKIGQGLFLYIDAKTVASNKAAIEQTISDELQIFGMAEADIRGVILDSWVGDDKEMNKILSLVSERFGSIALIVMHQINSASFGLNTAQPLNREFSAYFLWSLSRNVMRNIVSAYNSARPIGDEDAVTSRLAADLEVLNLHRTPLNCITLLKVSEFEFDESPVNRSEIIKHLLFLLFNVDQIPAYKSRPDLKDCEYVLGHFCEKLIRSDVYYFARDKFLLDIQVFCKENLIDLETHLVFDILYQNNIIVRTGNFFRFRFSYWIFYFAAQRMQHDDDFCSFVFEEMRYTRFPEIIEFYTGSDRRRNDALQILAKDLQDSRSRVQENCGLPEDVNPYRFAVWTVDEAARLQMTQEIADGVRDSNLPATIKDQYADRGYNKARPYNQEVSKLFSEHSFVCMLRGMSAAARALRNSDYATPAIKRDLLKEILASWEMATKVLFIVLPLLAEKGYASYDGMGFTLGEGFVDDHSERFIQILCCIPSNVMRWGNGDLYSRKMAPLLIDRINQSDVRDLEKHELILLLIENRPRDWERVVRHYIVENARNSFYLMDVQQALRLQYKMGFFENAAAKTSMEFLIKMVAAKHVTGEKKPTEKSFKKIKFAGDLLPGKPVHADIPPKV